MESMIEFWEGKKVLVTGHTGFKGMWLSIVLSQMGAKVIGLSKDDLTNKHFYTSVDNKIIFTKEITCDIRNSHEVEHFIEEIDPDIVFHLAAQPLVRASYVDPIETYETNVIGTVNVLNGTRKSKSCNSVICITSDKCCGNIEQIWGYREKDSLGGKDPYSASKGAAEIAAYSMWHSFLRDKGLNMATLRAGNVIGGGDFSADRIMTDILKAYQSGSTLSLRNPNATRPWQHVLEPIFAYLLMASEYFVGKTSSFTSFNVGPEPASVRSVSDLAVEVQKKWSIEIEMLRRDHQELHEATLLSLDNTKIKAHCSWKPRWDFETTINKTLNWYQRFSEGYDPLELCKTDIDEYMKEIQHVRT